MAELGETEDPAALIPGDPAALRAAGETYGRHAATLGQAADGLARLAVPEGWSGQAADRFRATVDLQPPRWRDAANAFRDAARAVDDHAVALVRARGQAADAIARWREAQAATAGAPDPGAAGRGDAQAILRAARAHVRESGDRAASVVTAACASAPAAPGFWADVADGAGHASAAIGNAAASVGNAMLRNPIDVGAALVGGGLVAVSAAGAVGSVGLDATGVGAIGGVPLGAASVAGMVTGVGIAGAAVVDLTQHAVTDDRVSSFTVATDADPGDATALPPAERLTTVGVPGVQERVRELPDEREIEELYEELAPTGTPVQWNSYSGEGPVRLPDGTVIGLRQSHDHGSTIDISLPDGTPWKIHRPT